MSKSHVIIGAGAMGLMERRARELMSKSSFQIREIDGERLEIPLVRSPLECGVHVCTHFNDVPSSSTVLLCVKHKDTRAVAEQLLGFADSQTEIVSLQNGIGNLEIVREVLGESHPAALYQGVSYLGAKLSEDGVVSTGLGKTVVGAAMPGPALIATLATLSQSGLEVQAVADASSMVWTKLLANAVINPLTAILDVSNGFVAESVMDGIVESLANEVAAVATAVGVELDLGSASPAEFARSIAQATRNNSSSMLVDIRTGRETEIQAINGGIVSIARKFGIPTPVNELVRSLVIAKGSIAKK